jgi:GST-like protein
MLEETGLSYSQLWHLVVFAKEQLPYAIEPYGREIARSLRALDGGLARRLSATATASPTS